MGRRKRVGDGRVLEAALEVLGDGGREHFTFARVAAAAGVAPATLVQRFGTKAELLVAAMAYGNGWLKAWLGTREGAGLPQLLGELSAGGEARGRFNEHLTFLREDLSDPDLAGLAADRIQLVRRAIAERLSRPDAETVDLIESQWHGAVLQWAIRPQGRLSTHVERSLAGLMRRIGV
jgi:AcrR family transcriptional regulator